MVVGAVPLMTGNHHCSVSFLFEIVIVTMFLDRGHRPILRGGD